ncbi:MAG: TonB C-terminal domain-containing protein [Saccharospirillaceae bacterium]|nr:TonB C-terminal domain-containing protein [Saccharospirillaceae bacterium]
MQPLPEQPAPQRRQTGLVTEKEALSADPLERSYQQRLLAHLRERVIAPASFRGSVRLELTLSYRQIATSVRVIRSSGDQAMDDWAIKSALAANPYPRVPDELPASYTFRPTIRTQP